MPDDWSPKVKPKDAPPPVPQVLTIVLKADSSPSPPPLPMPPPTSNVRGWRFVPHRDADNLIDEIIATPIIE